MRDKHTVGKVGQGQHQNTITRAPSVLLCWGQTAIQAMMAHTSPPGPPQSCLVTNVKGASIRRLRVQTRDAFRRNGPSQLAFTRSGYWDGGTRLSLLHVAETYVDMFCASSYFRRCQVRYGLQDCSSQSCVLLPEAASTATLIADTRQKSRKCAETNLR